MNTYSRAGRVGLAVSMLASFACSMGSCTIAKRWLEHNCTVGEARSLEAELRAAGARAERDLIAAYQDGPGALTDTIAAESARNYDEVIAALDAGRSYGLSAAEIGAIRAESRPAHVRADIADYDEAYRSAALSGLAMLGLPDGVALVQSVARNTASTYHDAAVRALQRAGLPLPPP